MISIAQVRLPLLPVGWGRVTLRGTCSRWAGQGGDWQERQVDRSRHCNRAGSTSKWCHRQGTLGIPVPRHGQAQGPSTPTAGSVVTCVSAPPPPGPRAALRWGLCCRNNTVDTRQRSRGGSVPSRGCSPHQQPGTALPWQVADLSFAGSGQGCASPGVGAGWGLTHAIAGRWRLQATALSAGRPGHCHGGRPVPSPGVGGHV